MIEGHFFPIMAARPWPVPCLVSICAIGLRYTCIAWCGYFGAGEVSPILLLTLSVWTAKAPRGCVVLQFVRRSCHKKSVSMTTLNHSWSNRHNASGLQLPRPTLGHSIDVTADAVRTLITGSAISFFSWWQLSHIAAAFVPVPGLAQRLA